MLEKIFQWMKIQDEIGEPPWGYDFLFNLPESDYPKYLKKIFKYRTNQSVNLLPSGSKMCRGGGFSRLKFNDNANLKTFNQKIQWIKLYGITPLMRDCTDKVKVRDFVREKIGNEYLKPVLQIIPNCHDINAAFTAPRSDNDVSTYFDQINWEKLPDSFVIKCNHGSKWQYIINNKAELIENKRMYEIVKKNITGWLEQEFWCWNGFEMQYKGIEPKIIIEPLLKEDVNGFSEEINVFCFNGKPKYIIKMHNQKQISAYDENLQITDDVFDAEEMNFAVPADEIIIQTCDLSKKLSNNFNFVRVDWLIYKNKPYFNELTFTPYSGFRRFKRDEYDKRFGSWIGI